MQKLNREQLLFVYRIDRLSSLHKKKRIGQLNSNKNNLSSIAQPAIREKKEKKKDTYLPTNIQQ